MEYLVTWTIDIDADSPEEAAKKALHIQRDPVSSANMFEVRQHKKRQDLGPPVNIFVDTRPHGDTSCGY